MPIHTAFVLECEECRAVVVGHWSGSSLVAADGATWIADGGRVWCPKHAPKVAAPSADEGLSCRVCGSTTQQAGACSICRNSDIRLCHGETACAEMKAFVAATKAHEKTKSLTKEQLAKAMTSVTTGICYSCKRPVR
jgi:hypothetical protein